MEKNANFAKTIATSVGLALSSQLQLPQAIQQPPAIIKDEDKENLRALMKDLSKQLISTMDKKLATMDERITEALCKCFQLTKQKTQTNIIQTNTTHTKKQKTDNDNQKTTETLPQIENTNIIITTKKTKKTYPRKKQYKQTTIL